jgi:hypothetical protein
VSGTCTVLNKHAASHQSLWYEFATRLAQHRVQLEAAQGRSKEQTDWRSIVHGSYRRTWRFMRNKSHIRELKLPRAPRKGLINIAAAPNNQVLIVRPTGASLHDISLSCTQEATILSSWKIPGTTDFAALVDDAATLLIAFNEYSEERPRRIGVRSFKFFFASITHRFSDYRSSRSPEPISRL